MNAHTRPVADYRGKAQMEAAYEAIRQSGIRAARRAHFERRNQVEAFIAEPGMYFASIRPNLSTEETIAAAKRVIFGFRNLETWQQNNPVRRDRVVKARLSLLYARFFRRYGERAWIRRAA